MKPISARTALLAAMVAALGVLVALGLNAYNELSRYQAAQARHAELTRLADTILRLDDASTDSARIGSLTGEARWWNRHSGEVATLRAEMERAILLAGKPFEAEIVEAAHANEAILTMEARAQGLASGRVSRDAYEMLTSAEYQRLKAVYHSKVRTVLNLVRESVDLHAGKVRQAVAILLAAALLIALCSILVWRRQHAALLQTRQEGARSRQRLQELEELLMGAPAAIAVFERDMRYRFANTRWREDFWTPGLNNIGKVLYDLNESFTEEQRALHALIEAGEPVSVAEEYRPRKDGTDRWISWSLAPWRESDGTVTGSFAVAFDVTDQVRQRQVIEHRQALLREMQAMSAVGVAEVDIASKNLWMSEEGYGIFGLPRDQKVNLWDMAPMLSPEDQDIFLTAFSMAEERGTPFDLELPVTIRSGDQRWVRMKARPDTLAHAGKIVIAFQDVSDRKAIEEDLEAARERAEAANQSKSAFLANTSHEIRTPLNGVIGITGALARTNLTDAQAEMVSLIRTSGETLERLLNDILDLSKIEAGRLTIEDAPFSLTEIVEDAARLMRVRADDKGIDFNVVFGETARGEFRGDAIRIKQIIANLSSNAIKFTESGSVTVDVDVLEGANRDAPALVTFAVRDTGIGFDAEAAQRLFQRFEQADGSITRQYGGTGLGLSISRALTDMMGGEISARSAPGEGSTFTVRLPLPRTLPLAEFDRRQRYEDDALIAAPVEGADGRPLQILLAEDHPVNQRVVCLILEPYGVEVTIANNGAEAVDLFGQQRFDMILMDMQMPVMDGLTAVARIRELEAALGTKRTPIAMLTANAMAEHRDATGAAGADFHIAKPVSPDALLAGIEAAMARSEEQVAKAA